MDDGARLDFVSSFMVRLVHLFEEEKSIIRHRRSRRASRSLIESDELAENVFELVSLIQKGKASVSGMHRLA